MIKLLSFNLKVFFNLSYYTIIINVILKNKVMKFFIYYFNYLVLNTQTQESNLENSNILDFETFSIKSNQMSQEQRFHPSLFKERVSLLE